ncbi:MULTISPECIES: Dabb family protein [unclassified Streptomyces]|uniref:Dabb family protein n=1 Tax=unclassified Streptomyces TaxID=2593676 RepID=UPI002DDBF79D|nr:Dabb family protein [Streptomyces sp. NBC_01750]WSA97992.1 Dabb family protein [Streptomyces sp. NBC_01794]WSD37455.1 Dabb family protein [Streptomyces sp. NBC_01750]
MITHIALFKLKDGFERCSPAVVEAEKSAKDVCRNVPELLTWRTGWNTVDRDISYDFAVIGILPNLAALEKYQANPFHRLSVERWRAISDWVVIDLNDA